MKEIRQRAAQRLPFLTNPVSCTYACYTRLLTLTLIYHTHLRWAFCTYFPCLERQCLFLFSVWQVLLPNIRDSTQMYLLYKAAQSSSEQINYMQPKPNPYAPTVVPCPFYCNLSLLASLSPPFKFWGWGPCLTLLCILSI